MQRAYQPEGEALSGARFDTLPLHQFQERIKLNKVNIVEYMEAKMQQAMEASEAEYDYLSQQLDPPLDWDLPQWDEPNRVHNWRNYADGHLIELWPSLSGKARLIIAANLKSIADREDWE